MNIELSIVSGTYNRLPHLQKMVDSVRRSIGVGIPYELVLVDGGSTDGTQAWAKSQRDIVLIEQGELRGAIAAYAEGFKRARGRFVVIANDDLVFVGNSIQRAHVFMLDHDGIGIGAFYTDRFRNGVRVDIMPGRDPYGVPISVHYGGIIIIPKWLGDRLDWWTLPGARTYGGDCGLCARAYEAGYTVAPIGGTLVQELVEEDDLKRANNDIPEKQGGNHPDTVAYLKAYPAGPKLNPQKAFGPPDDWRRPRRILYAPIYEQFHRVQHEQKRGLRQALGKLGLVWEVDYLTLGPDAILEAAQLIRPHMVVTQFHDAETFTEQHILRLRNLLPKATFVNWNGDVYDRSQHRTMGRPYCDMLRHFHLHTVVNETSVVNYEAMGVPTAYWQLGWEPDGIGHEPAPDAEQYEVVFLGNGYSENRHRLGNFLTTIPYKLGVWGDGWPMLKTNPANTYNFKWGCQIYRAGKIALGDSEWATTARGFVSNRVLQAMAAGKVLMLQQWFDGYEELLGLVDGKHWVLWRDFDDLRAKLDYYLTHEDERRKIAQAGTLEVLRNHSFDKRIEELQHLLDRPREVTIDDPTLTIAHRVVRKASAE